MTTYESRDQIPQRYTWDLSNIFPDDPAFFIALEDAKQLPARFESFKGTLAAGGAPRLLELLRVDDEASVLLGKLSNYASRKSDEDTRDNHYQDMEAQVMNLFVAIGSSFAWFSNELLAIGAATVETWYDDCPDLKLYKRVLDRVFRRAPHVLSPAEEQLLAAAQDMAAQPSNIYSLLNDADMTFRDAVDSTGATHPVTHGSYIPLMMQPDRALRQSAYESLYATYQQFRNTCAATLGAQAKQQQFFSDARKYASSLEAALDGNEIPTQVYHALIEAVHRNLPALHRYVALRSKLMGLEQLRYWDLYVPVVEGIDPRYTYEEACELILAALEPMGPEYLSIVRQGLDQRWVDVYETPGKRSGAYSAGGYGMHPVILLNFQGTLDDVFTLIHEMGHSLHTYLSCANQPVCYSDYAIFVAEVASTCNEALLMHYLLDHASDPRMRAYLLNHFLEQFRGTIYRQTMFAEFELKVNELQASGQGVTADALCDIYGQLNQDYYGPGITVDEQIRCEWARIPHFYYHYYVYQYATGFSAAIALSNRILREGAPAVQDYLGFLKGGCSKTPIELLRGAGVDMASPDPIDDALHYFDELIGQMEELLQD
ncbi:MAG: oligoendopeptidase F [Coriobacteriales bacterium]|nr:oligoendopeptidase F [Coriobacteriales bacterium]